MKTAIYPGTFDPITQGHVEIVKRAAKLFDCVIVAVAVSERKNPLIAMTDRLQLVQQVFVNEPTVEVKQLTGLVVDFAKTHQAKYLIRGLRGGADFDYEMQLAGMNKKLAPELETLFIPANAGQQFVSATLVREIAKLNGDISQFVPKEVIEYLKNGT